MLYLTAPRTTRFLSVSSLHHRVCTGGGVLAKNIWVLFPHKSRRGVANAKRRRVGGGWGMRRGVPSQWTKGSGEHSELPQWDLEQSILKVTDLLFAPIYRCFKFVSVSCHIWGQCRGLEGSCPLPQQRTATVCVVYNRVIVYECIESAYIIIWMDNAVNI